MYCIVEKQDQLDVLKSKKLKQVYIQVIEGNFYYHPIFNTIVGVYIRDIYDNKGYFLCLNHNDTLSLDIYEIFNFLNSIDTIYVNNYKKFLYFFNLQNPKIVDINENHLLDSSNKVILTSLFDFYYNNHKLNINLNSIIPVLKLYEYCDNYFESIKQYCYNNEKYVYNDISKVFYLIESNGLKLKETAVEQLKIENDKLFIDQSNIIYSNYNLYNLTGRPSNAFNNFNFMAIDKQNGDRENIIPKNDILIEIDFTAYHPYIIANILNHKFKKTPYEDFADEFDMDISTAKKIMFQNIYGGIYDKYKDFPFFAKLNNLIEEYYNKYLNNTLVIPESGFTFSTKDYPNLTKTKLFNYIIQNIETFNNVKILKKILKILNNKTSQIILYTYDAILLDFSKEESLYLEYITDYLEKNNIKFKLYKGKNYNKMNKVYEV